MSALPDSGGTSTLALQSHANHHTEISLQGIEAHEHSVLRDSTVEASRHHGELVKTLKSSQPALLESPVLHLNQSIAESSCTPTVHNVSFAAPSSGAPTTVDADMSTGTTYLTREYGRNYTTPMRPLRNDRSQDFITTTESGDTRPRGAQSLGSPMMPDSPVPVMALFQTPPRKPPSFPAESPTIRYEPDSDSSTASPVGLTKVPAADADGDETESVDETTGFQQPSKYAHARKAERKAAGKSAATVDAAFRQRGKTQPRINKPDETQLKDVDRSAIGGGRQSPAKPPKQNDIRSETQTPIRGLNSTPTKAVEMSASKAGAASPAGVQMPAATPNKPTRRLLPPTPTPRLQSSMGIVASGAALHVSPESASFKSQTLDNSVQRRLIPGSQPRPVLTPMAFAHPTPNDTSRGSAASPGTITLHELTTSTPLRPAPSVENEINLLHQALHALAVDKANLVTQVEDLTVRLGQIEAEREAAQASADSLSPKLLRSERVAGALRIQLEKERAANKEIRQQITLLQTAQAEERAKLVQARAEDQSVIARLRSVNAGLVTQLDASVRENQNLRECLRVKATELAEAHKREVALAQQLDDLRDEASGPVGRRSDSSRITFLQNRVHELEVALGQSQRSSQAQSRALIELVSLRQHHSDSEQHQQQHQQDLSSHEHHNSSVTLETFKQVVTQLSITELKQISEIINHTITHQSASSKKSDLDEFLSQVLQEDDEQDATYTDEAVHEDTTKRLTTAAVVTDSEDHFGMHIQVRPTSHQTAEETAATQDKASASDISLQSQSVYDPLIVARHARLLAEFRDITVYSKLRTEKGDIQLQHQQQHQHESHATTKTQTLEKQQHEFMLEALTVERDEAFRMAEEANIRAEKAGLASQQSQENLDNVMKDLLESRSKLEHAESIVAELKLELSELRTKFEVVSSTARDSQEELAQTKRKLEVSNGALVEATSRAQRAEEALECIQRELGAERARLSAHEATSSRALQDVQEISQIMESTIGRLGREVDTRMTGVEARLCVATAQVEHCVATLAGHFRRLRTRLDVEKLDIGTDAPPQPTMTDVSTDPLPQPEEPIQPHARSNPVTEALPPTVSHVTVATQTDSTTSHRDDNDPELQKLMARIAELERELARAKSRQKAAEVREQFVRDSVFAVEREIEVTRARLHLLQNGVMTPAHATSKSSPRSRIREESATQTALELMTVKKELQATKQSVSELLTIVLDTSMSSQDGNISGENSVKEVVGGVQESSPATTYMHADDACSAGIPEDIVVEDACDVSEENLNETYHSMTVEDLSDRCQPADSDVRLSSSSKAVHPFSDDLYARARAALFCPSLDSSCSDTDAAVPPR